MGKKSDSPNIKPAKVIQMTDPGYGTEDISGTDFPTTQKLGKQKTQKSKPNAVGIENTNYPTDIEEARRPTPKPVQ